MSKRITYYQKVGRRYRPVYEYDQKLMDALPKGTHLIQVYPGGKSTRCNINPAYAPMIAAGRVAEDKISDAIRKATDMRPASKETKLTEEQIRCWKELSKAFGEDNHALQWPSAREACEEAVKAMSVEAEKLLSVPAVRKAYEHFLFVAELTKEHKNESNS
jgi:superfamily II DNA or RNA helicase